MKILITGGAGFIGYHLSKSLLKDKHNSLVLVDNLQRGKMDKDFDKILANPRVSFKNLDLTKTESFKKLGKGYDHIYHLAAVNGTRFFYEIPHEALRINILSLMNILDWMIKDNPKAKLCFPSSNEAYGGGLDAFGQLPIPTPENVPLVIPDPHNPRWSYAATKLVGELLVIHYSRVHNLRSVIIRPHNFYGPRAGYDHVIPEFSARIINRVEPFPIFGPDDTRTFCYIDDAVRAMILLMQSPKTDKIPVEIVHIGDTEEIAISKLAEKMFKVSGWKPKKIEEHSSPQGSVKRRLADISKIKEMVGWEPQVKLDKGLRDTMNWYKKNPKNK